MYPFDIGVMKYETERLITENSEIEKEVKNIYDENEKALQESLQDRYKKYKLKQEEPPF